MISGISLAYFRTLFGVASLERDLIGIPKWINKGPKYTDHLLENFGLDQVKGTEKNKQTRPNELKLTNAKVKE